MGGNAVLLQQQQPIKNRLGELNTYTYVRGDPISRRDPLGLTDLIFDAQSGRLHVIDQYGNSAGNFPASNNPVAGQGQFPAGTYPFSWWNPHRGASENSSFGQHGNFIFDVPNRSGMGVHSGRANTSCSPNRCGFQYPTDGCIRTIDDATEAIKRLHTGGDRVRSISVLR